MSVRPDLKICKEGNHIFNIQNGFLLLRYYSGGNRDYEDGFFCLECAKLVSKNRASKWKIQLE